MQYQGKHYQVHALSEQALEQQFDTLSNKASSLQNEAQDDFLSQNFTYHSCFITKISAMNGSKQTEISRYLKNDTKYC